MLNYIYNLAKSVRDKISSLGEKGQGMVEYAIILAVVAVIAVAVLGTSTSDENDGTLAGAIKGAFGTATKNIDSAAGITKDDGKEPGTS